MISEQELWACASLVLQQRGDLTDEHIAERVAALAAAGDEAGVATWRAIADRIDTLRDTQGNGLARH